MLQHRRPTLTFVTIPEGMPSVLVHDKLMATTALTGPVPIPPEGTVLPDSYAYQRGETRLAVVERMQRAMDRALADEWATRSTDLAVSTPAEALILASIVEKETGVAAERATVAAVYANRLKRGMPLQADPTVIYPVTKGRPLGRRILESELHAKNGYNTYADAWPAGWADLQSGARLDRRGAAPGREQGALFRRQRQGRPRLRRHARRAQRQCAELVRDPPRARGDVSP